MDIIEFCIYWLYMFDGFFVYSIDRLRVHFSMKDIIDIGKEIKRVFENTRIHEEAGLCYNKKIYKFTINVNDPSSFVYYNIFIKIKSDSINGMYGYIDFNPNKVFQNPSAFMQIKAFFSKVICTKAFFDIAIDSSLNILSLVPQKVDSRKMKYLVESKTNYTVYLGKPNNDGFVKIYNKSEEIRCKMGKDCKVDITRIELTAQFSFVDFKLDDWNKRLIYHLPKIKSIANERTLPICFDEKLSKNEIAIVELINLFRTRKDFDMQNAYVIAKSIEKKAYKKILPYITHEMNDLMFDVHRINKLVEKAIYEITGQFYDFSSGKNE